MFDRNKQRLYIAYYPRGGPTKSTPFHAALFLTPKSPEPTSNIGSFRYHVLNVPEPSSKIVWKYTPSRLQHRTMRLHALLLLGKVAVSGERLGEMLREVVVVQDDPDWQCTNWVCSAIQVSCGSPQVSITVDLKLHNT